MPSERPLLITGMHRSGTSLLTSVLARAGVDIGDELLGPAQGNPRGHFEDVHFLNLQEHALRNAGQSMLLRHLEDIPSPNEEMMEEARQLCVGRSGLWGFKDPRTCLFLELWLRLLPDAGFVLIFRHPFDVFSSLLRRGTDLEILLDPQTAFDSWTVYNRRLLDFYREHEDRCLLVSLEGAVQDLDFFVEAVAQKLEVPLSPRGAKGSYEPSELRPPKRHQHLIQRLHELTPESLALYEELLERADLSPPREGDEPAPPVDSDIDSASLLGLLEIYEPQALVRREQALLEQLFLRNNPEQKTAFPTAIGPLLERHQARSEELEQLTKRMGSLETQLSKQQEELEAFERHGSNLEDNLEECRGNLEELTQHASNLEVRSTQQDQLIEEFTDHTNNLEAQLGQHQNDLKDLRKHTENLELRSTQQDQEIQDLNGHNNNLEYQLDQHRKDLSELKAHAGNLELRCTEQGQLIEGFTDHTAHQEALLDQLGEHSKNLDQRCTQQELLIEDFTDHSNNLEILLGRCRSDLAELGEHARNLEEQLARQQALWEDLRSHARNLETEIGQRDQVLRDLTEHTANLQQDLEERQRNLDDFVRHSRNLEDIRSEQQAHIEALSSRLQKLAPRTTETN